MLTIKVFTKISKKIQKKFNFLVLHIQTNEIFSHNSKHLLTFGNHILGVMDDFEFIGFMEYLEGDNCNQTCVLSKKMDSDVSIDTKLYIEV